MFLILPAVSSFLALSLTLQVCVADEEAFTHPGVLHSLAELEFVKAKVAEGAEPWKRWAGLRKCTRWMCGITMLTQTLC